MSVTPALAQIPDVKPVAPPFIPDLIGKFDTLWWLLLVAGIVACAVGYASYRGNLRMSISTEFPVLAGGPVAVIVAIVALIYGT